MKNPLIAVLVATLSLLATAAYANPAHHAGGPQPAVTARPGSSPAMGASGMMGMSCPMMGGHTEGSLAFLKAELKVTDAQGAAWTAFADGYRVFAASAPQMPMQSGGMMGGGASMPAGQGSTTFPEHMKARMQMMEDRAAAAKKFEPAVDALYNVLNAEQKKTADDLFPMFTMAGRMM